MKGVVATNDFGDIVPASPTWRSPRDLLRATAFLVAVFAAWSILGRYWGIQHDALAYMLQAVAILKPDPLAADVFLRYRSQEEFTVFPQLCAYAIAWLGLDRAGSILTLSFLTFWITAAWFVVRRLAGNALAFLSVGFLLVIPGWYSAGQVFRYAEPFLTARSLAEALSLSALLAILYSQRLVAAGLLALAFVVHPLMAFPMALLIIALTLPLKHWVHWSGALLVVVLGATAGSALAMLPDPLMHGDWLQVTRWRSGFLFAGEWTARDRGLAAQTLLTLTVGVAALPESTARRVFIGVLAIGLAGLILTVLSSELLPLKLLLQGQPWRWMWIGRFVATALLPLVVLALWRHDLVGRSVSVLLSSAWLLTDAGSFRDVEPIGIAGLLCILSLVLWLGRKRVSAQAARTSLIMSLCVLAVVLLFFVSVMLTAASASFTGFGRDPIWVQRVADVLYTPGIAALCIFLAWHSTIFLKKEGRSALIAVAAMVLLVGAMPETARSWTDAPFNDRYRADFADWRSFVPPEAEVLWHEAPQAAWFLLDRRSYISVSQAAGTVFSRDSTNELIRRSNVLSALVAPGVWFMAPHAQSEEFNDLSSSILRQICQDPELGFVVSPDDTGSAVYRAEWPGKANFFYLYDCRDYRAMTFE